MIDPVRLDRAAVGPWACMTGDGVLEWLRMVPSLTLVLLSGTISSSPLFPACVRGISYIYPPNFLFFSSPLSPLLLFPFFPPFYFFFSFYTKFYIHLSFSHDT